MDFWRIPSPLSELEIPRAGRPTESEVQVFMPWLGPNKMRFSFGIFEVNDDMLMICG